MSHPRPSRDKNGRRSRRVAVGAFFMLFVALPALAQPTPRVLVDKPMVVTGTRAIPGYHQAPRVPPADPTFLGVDTPRVDGVRAAVPASFRRAAVAAVGGL